MRNIDGFQSKDSPECCNRSVRHGLLHSLALVSVVPNCCLVGDGGVGGESLARVVRSNSSPAVAGQTAHPLTRCAKQHCWIMLDVVYRNKWASPATPLLLRQCSQLLGTGKLEAEVETWTKCMCIIVPVHSSSLHMQKRTSPRTYYVFYVGIVCQFDCY